MKLHYYPDTDSLYIEFSEEAGAETREVSDGVNVDIDARGNLVGSTSIMPRTGSTRPPWRQPRYRAPARSPELRAPVFRPARTRLAATAG